MHPTMDLITTSMALNSRREATKKMLIKAVNAPHLAWLLLYPSLTQSR